MPFVKVPVLSKTIALTLHAASNGSPPLIRTPCSAPLPVPTIIAVGVANPRAHGHAITITDVNAIRANESPAPKKKYQTMNVNAAKIKTAGTNRAEILSAIACIGAFEPWASSINLII